MSDKSIEYEPIKVKNTFEFIVDQLREKIFNGELKIGDRLPTERELAQKVQVSRNTVRQAYQILNLLDIVDITKGANGGAVIREPSHRPLTQALNNLIGLGKITLEDITQARMMIEKDIIELVHERITPSDIERLEQCAKKSMALIAQGKMAHKQNFIFHQQLADIGGNPILKMVYASVLDLLNMVVETTADINMSAIIATEHFEFINLLKKNDLDQLIEYTEAHIRGSNERLYAISDGKPILTMW